MRPNSRRWLIVFGWAGWMGCGELADRPGQVERAAPRIRWDPAFVDDRAAPIFHAAIDGLGANVEPLPLIVEGTATPNNVADLAADEASDSLRDRIVPSTAWMVGVTWFVAPTQPLSLGERYSIVVPSARWSETITVMSEDDLPMFKRQWPPDGTAGRHLVWCLQLPASGKAAELSSPMALSGVDGVLSQGAVDRIGTECLRWTPLDNASGLAVPPPAMELDGRWVRMDPSPTSLDPADEGMIAATCGGEDVAVGPLCVRVLDDRAIVSTSESPWLVSVETSEVAWVGVIEPQSPRVFRPLVPSSEVGGVVTVVGTTGRSESTELDWRTTPPQVHVVINEVMTNPRGPEPSQEWIELYNDGTEPVLLEGWSVQDAGGSVELPLVELGVGAFALVVGEGYDAASWVDAAPWEEAAILRVPHVGKSGLSNGGEPVRLVDGEGRTVSAVPAIAAEEQGWSIARVSPESLDGLSSSFAFGIDGGTPGGPNGALEAGN